jgi:monoamine oxidase
LLSVEPADISPFYLLWYTACNSGFLNEVNDDKGGPQQYWLRTGMSSLAEAFAKPILSRIDQGTKIASVDHSGDVVVATTTEGKVYRAKKLLVALSPHSAGRIRFTPPPPPARQALFDLPMGKTIKCQLFYDKRWWWDSKGNKYDGYVGGADYPVLWVMDNSPPDADTPEGNGPFVLMTFTVGDQVDKLGPKATDAEIEKSVSDALAFLFDDDRARDFKKIVIHRWVPSDPFVGGGPNTVFTPGLLSGEAGKIMNEPWGDKIFFASSENVKTLAPTNSARTWHLFPLANEPKYSDDGVLLSKPPPPYTSQYSDLRRSLGYMDGAIESGRYGAHVVAKSLGFAYNTAIDAAIAPAPVASPPAPVVHDAAAAAALLSSVEAKLGANGAADGRLLGAASRLQAAFAEALVEHGHAPSVDHPSVLSHLRDFAASIIGHAKTGDVALADQPHVGGIKAAISSIEAKIKATL